MGAKDQSAPCCKVGRVVRAYGLEALGVELERRWTGQTGESASLRELQREFNRELLRVALADAGVVPIEGEAENFRNLLRGSDVDKSRRVEATRRLENDGVDVEQLQDDFVSHQTIHNHLRNCRDVSVPDRHSDAEQRAASTIFGLRNRTAVITEQTLTQLGTSGVVSPSTFDVIVDIQAICDECGRSNDVGDLLETGACHCQNG